MRRAGLIVLASAALVAAAPVAPASAAASCKHHSTEIARKRGSTLWLSANRKVLYACTSFYEEPPHDLKLGPWSSKSRAAFDGSTAVWTIRAGGVDTVWAADGAAPSSPAWLRGVTPVAGHGSSTDNVVAALKVSGDAAAWVTSKGTVMMAVRSPDSDPTLIGAGTPGAAATPAVSPTTDLPQGLAADPPKPKGQRIVVGRWETLDPATLGASLTLVEGTGGDGDECGGTSEYEATVVPLSGQAPVGIDWYSSWSSDSGTCA